MTQPRLPERAGASIVRIIGNIKSGQLDAPTPCADYDVAKLLNHLLFWGPSLAAAARKETVAPPTESETGTDLVGADWRDAVPALIESTVAAWSRPEAWEGMTRMGGPDETPAALIGGMVVVELVVHGWDLARATGQHHDWDDDLVAFVHAEVGKTAEFGRELGAYGPRVDVPESSSTFDRMLGLTGRDPAWAR